MDLMPIAAKTRIVKTFAAGLLLGLVLLFAVPVAVFAQSESDSGSKTESADLKPELVIDIPTVKFSDAQVDTVQGKKIVNLPWIAQYLNGVFVYAVGIGAFLAGIMIIIGGFIYLTSGDSGRTMTAKSMITNAVLGLSVMLGSYVLLNTVNPDLTELDVIQIQTVKQETYDFSAANASDESISGSGTVSANSADLVDIRQLFKQEKPLGFAENAVVTGPGNKKVWEMLKKVGEKMDTKGCKIVTARGMGRTGLQQFNGVLSKGGKLSSKCGIYYGCRVSMGKWCSTKDDEDEACKSTYHCKWTAPKQPDTSAPASQQCDMNSVMHTEASDTWAVEKEGPDRQCGIDNVKCAKHRCQRELIHAWTAELGGGLMMQRAKDFKSRGFESWHLCMNASAFCGKDADAIFAQNGYPYPAK